MLGVLGAHQDACRADDDAVAAGTLPADRIDQGVRRVRAAKAAGLVA